MQTLKSKEKVTIIGAGWLGLPLAMTLSKDKFPVVATKKSPKTAQDLQKQCSEDSLEFLPFDVLSLFEKPSETISNHATYYQKLFSDSHIIITIPPSSFAEKISSKSTFSYADAIQYIISLTNKWGAKSIIFTSSISVYGKSSGLVNEELPVMPESTNAKAIIEAENALRSQASAPTVILRLGGLIGNGRHPIHSLSGKNNIQEPNNAINLVHISDVIDAITALLKREMTLKYQVYNIVTPVHPNRKSYYEAVAQHLSLPAPKFIIGQSLLTRVIDGNRITEQGDFTYRVLDLVKAPL